MTRPETRRTTGQYLPLAGAAFTALMVLGAAAFPMPPGGDISPASKPDWLAAHYNAAIAQSYVRALAALAFLALTASIVAACRRVLPEESPLPTVALVGGAFSGGLLLIAQAVGLAAALFVHAGGNADTTRALGALQDGFLNLSSIPAVLLFAATGITALRTGLLPRWLGIFSLVGVPFALADAASYDGGPLESIGIIGLLFFIAWSLLTGVRLYLTHRASSTATASEPEPILAA